MMWHLGALWDCITGQNERAWKQGKITGTVLLVKEHVYDLPDYSPSRYYEAHDMLGDAVSFRLVSSTFTDPSNGKGKVGKEAHLEEWVTTMTTVAAGESKFTISFDWDFSQGVPGAIIVKNNRDSEFFLKTLTLHDVPSKGNIHFICNSWINTYDRVFFTNDTYLPSQMPAPLLPYREQELGNLRGHDALSPLAKHDRVYSYDVYNDLSDPDKGEDHQRPTLGGPNHPYPRRCRTNWDHDKKNLNTNKMLDVLHSINIYVPRDEQLRHLKLADSFVYVLESLIHVFRPAVGTVIKKEFNSFKETLDLYDGKTPLLHHSHFLEKLEHFLEKQEQKVIPELFKASLLPDGGDAFHLPKPQVIKESESAWRTDEEFAREMLAGANPIIIRCLQEFPPTSKLDKQKYGYQDSTITEEHILNNLSGLTVHQALKEKRLFILDHHDTFMPYLTKFNALEKTCIYATRTLLFLKNDGTLKPLAIELSMPHPDGVQYGAESEVYTPSPDGTVEGSIWQLAKAYVAVNDSGYHQLISHWLNTHAVIEPFIIATHRQLSVTHPIHKLMSPHYRDTMKINALARQALINAGGILEHTLFPQKYAMEMSSDVYRSWKLIEQGLPDDLIKRGVAVEDHSSTYKLRLLIRDYPYAVDGLAIWSAIESWVNEYCSLYYPNDLAVKSDTELQSWWKEIREVGHGDKKDETWWPKMHTVKELTKTCTTIIWIASALHAAVNFGQYPYAGYLPNRPTISREKMPKPGSKDYEDLKSKPEEVFLRTITSRWQTLLGISLIEVLSRHSSDEVYLGQRDDMAEWTSDKKALRAFDKFRERLVGIEDEIMRLNGDRHLKNRHGPVEFEFGYTLLYPNTSEVRGTGGKLQKTVPKGIPNSVSI